MGAGLAATSTQTMASHCTTSPQALNPGAPEGTTGGRTAPDTRTEPSGSYVDVDGPRTAKGWPAGCTDQSGVHGPERRCSGSSPNAGGGGAGDRPHRGLGREGAGRALPPTARERLRRRTESVWEGALRPSVRRLRTRAPWLRQHARQSPLLWGDARTTGLVPTPADLS